MAKTIQLKPTSKPKRYKYNIRKLVGDLPHSIKVGDVVSHLVNAGIPQHDYYRHRDLEIDSTKSITADDLLIYAKVFDCSIDDLINSEVNATSIREKMVKRPKVKHGLK